MPLYEYGCSRCEHRFERLQKFNDPKPDACPQCGEDAVRKLVSRTTFKLKGSGWYSDHYGLKSPAAGGDSSGDPSKSSSSSSSSSSPSSESSATPSSTSSPASSSGGSSGASSSGGSAGAASSSSSKSD